MIVAFGLVLVPSCYGQTAVSTAHYDNFRTGANTHETVLTPANVNPQQFGWLARLPVSGCVVAQPLFAPQVPAADRPHNVVLIATTTNMVYAYDADDFSLQWSANFGTPFDSSIPWDGTYQDFVDCNLDPNNTAQGPIGIVGSPVLDPANQAMYFVASTMDGDPNEPQFHNYLHKVRLADGSDSVPPVEIAGTYSGISFDSRYQMQRSALLMQNGRIYIAFASHGDEPSYYGWLFSYDTNLNQVALMNYSAGRQGAGIWQSGGGPASDGQYIYFNTGNSNDTDPGGNAESVLQVDPNTLEVVAKLSFYPESEDWDADNDLDLGSSRVIVAPGTNRVLSGSKVGDLFSVNQNGMSLEVRQQAAARESVGDDWTGIYNGFAYWNRAIYVWPGGGGAMWPYNPPFPTDSLKAYALTPDYTSMTLLAQGQSDGLGVGHQGANIVISANGQDPSTGIVWAAVPAYNTSGPQPAFLHAYNASDFSQGIFKELWNNAQDPEDSGCSHAKFSQPLVANGKVFLPTYQGRVIVYGLTDSAGRARNATKRGHLPKDSSSLPGFCSPLFAQ